LDQPLCSSWESGGWPVVYIGKSTMAEAVYHRNYRQLEGHCFFRNVREETEKHGRAHVQQEILGEVYKRRKI